MTGIFSWGRTTPLVSVSDGDSVPEVYAYADVLTASFGNATFIPSPLVEIDGQNATEFLLNWSQYGSLQDRDALWNNLFYTLAQVSLGSSGTGTGTFSGGGRGARIYPGETTTLKFANGTTVVNENFARVLAPFDNITSGEDIYREFFTIPEGEPQSAEEIATSTTSSSTEAPTSSETASTTTTPVPAPGYPTPFVNGDFNANSGYFLSGDEYDDVAVLAVRSFVGGSGSQENFQAVNTYLIDQAVAQNKTKLIIDVSANGGGTILQGYDLFTQLFHKSSLTELTASVHTRRLISLARRLASTLVPSTVTPASTRVLRTLSRPPSTTAPMLRSTMSRSLHGTRSSDPMLMALVLTTTQASSGGKFEACMVLGINR